MGGGDGTGGGGAKRGKRGEKGETKKRVRVEVEKKIGGRKKGKRKNNRSLSLVRTPLSRAKVSAPAMRPTLRSPLSPLYSAPERERERERAGSSAKEKQFDSKGRKKGDCDCSFARLSLVQSRLSPPLLPRGSGAPRTLRQQGHSPRRCWCSCSCWCPRRRSARGTDTKTEKKRRRRRCSQPSSPPKPRRRKRTRWRRRGRALRGCAAFGSQLYGRGCEGKKEQARNERGGFFFEAEEWLGACCFF